MVVLVAGDLPFRHYSAGNPIDKSFSLADGGLSALGRAFRAALDELFPPKPNDAYNRWVRKLRRNGLIRQRRTDPIDAFSRSDAGYGSRSIRMD